MPNDSGSHRTALLNATSTHTRAPRSSESQVELGVKAAATCDRTEHNPEPAQAQESSYPTLPVAANERDLDAQNFQLS